MVYFVGTEKSIMVNYNEIESLEIENNTLFIYFKSGNIVKLNVDIEDITEIIEYYDRLYSKKYFLSNKKDIETDNLLMELRDKKSRLEVENRKFAEIENTGRICEFFDYESMSDKDKETYDETIKLLKDCKYSFQE